MNTEEKKANFKYPDRSAAIKNIIIAKELNDKLKDKLKELCRIHENIYNVLQRPVTELVDETPTA